MKKIKNVCLIVILFFSLTCNGFLVYYLCEINKPSSSIVKLGFSEHNIEIYCEKVENVETVKIDFNNDSYKIGNAEFVNKEDLWLVSPEEKINLSQKGLDAFVINSNGKLIYQLVKPEKTIYETVFVTPSGRKYHSDAICAGRTAFETDSETAKLFGRKPCSICLH